MSDLFGNHIVGFPTRRLICSVMSEVSRGSLAQGCIPVPVEFGPPIRIDMIQRQALYPVTINIGKVNVTV